MKNPFSNCFRHTKILLFVLIVAGLTIALAGCEFNSPPTAVIEETVNSQDGTVTFDLSQSSDEDGSIVSYKFYPRSDADPETKITEDEEPMTTGGWDSITESPSSGEYTATLTVYDDEGESDTVSQDYSIN